MGRIVWPMRRLRPRAALLALLLLAVRPGTTHAAMPAHPLRDPAAEFSTVVPADTSEFLLFAWVSPPADSTTEARIAEMAALSLDLTMPAWLDRGFREDNLDRLDWAARQGMRCIIWDRRLEGAFQWLPTFEDTLDQVVADYRTHPAFWGYYLGDEPDPEIWPLLARLRAALRQRDPDHPAWNNLRGLSSFGVRSVFEDMLTGYSDQFHPAVLSVDHYDLLYGSDRGWFVENAVTISEFAESRGLPYWDFIQLIPHWSFRPLQPGEMRWQVAQMLAYGARGIGYFTYWTPDPDPALQWQSGIIAHDGTRTPWYDFLRDFNPRVRVAGRALARAHRRRTTHSGSLPRGAHAFTPDDWIADVSGRAAIGEFEEPGGGRLLLVANSDSSSAQAITLRLGERSRVRIVASGAPVTLPFEAGFPGITELTLPLEAGDFALLELTPLGPPTFTLALAPNPASGRVRFALVAPSGSRFEIIDLSGRRVWGRSLDRGITAFEWRGERDDGGTAGPGMYFARLRDGIESAPRRFVWLGSR